MGKGKVADDVTLTTPDCLSELLIAPTTDLSLKETEATMPMFWLEKVYYYLIILTIHTWSIDQLVNNTVEKFSVLFTQLSFSRSPNIDYCETHEKENCPNIVKHMSGKIAQIL